MPKLMSICIRGDRLTSYLLSVCSAFLGSTGSGARCYNASDAELNSTAWFVSNIGNFVTFITLDDLTTFVSTAQVFPEITYAQLIKQNTKSVILVGMLTWLTEISIIDLFCFLIFKVSSVLEEPSQPGTLQQ